MAAWAGWNQQRGRTGGRGPVNNWMPGHDPRHRALPSFLTRLGDPGDPTMFTLDRRDGRIVSPFQQEFPFAIEVNAEAGVNRITEHQQALSPNAGVYLQVYYVITTNTHKLNMAISFDVPEGVQCGKWDDSSGRVLSHAAFQPFDWPSMVDGSPPYVDLKVKFRGSLLLHVIMKSFRSKTDLTIQKQWIDEALLAVISEDQLKEVQVQHTIFQGYDVCSHTFEAGRRVYALSTNGTIVALSEPRTRIEIRKIAWGSPDLHGNEPDRLEYKFLDVSNNLTVACNRLAVPPSWIVLSNISGPACATIIQEARNSGAVAQAPDQHMQFGQLAAVHQAWFPDSTLDPGAAPQIPEFHKCRVAGDPVHSKHVIIGASVRFHGRSVVAGDALAIGAHDPQVEANAIVLPPAPGFGSVVLAAPALGDDPTAAINLPPIISFTVQPQPEIARGAATLTEEGWFLGPAVDRVLLQEQGKDRPDQAESYAAPIFSRSVEERRQAAPKRPAPLPPLALRMEELSAPTTVRELAARLNVDDRAGRQPLALADDRGVLLHRRDRLTAAVNQAAGYVQRLIAQVDNMKKFTEDQQALNAPAPYIEHLTAQLGRDEAVLATARVEFETLNTALESLDDAVVRTVASSSQ